MRRQPDSREMVSPLRQLRLDRGKTLREVALAIGYDEGNLSRVERGQLRSVDAGLALVRYFGDGAISLEQILRPTMRPRRYAPPGVVLAQEGAS